MNGYYTGVDRSVQMRHWKYIKKVRKNGKWVYYYDRKQMEDDLGITAKKNLQTAKNEAEIAEASFILGQRNKAEYEAYAKSDKKISSYERKRLDEKEADTTNREKTYIEAGKNYKKAKETYMNTPLGKIERVGETIKRGASKIADLFKKTVTGSKKRS